MNPRIAEKIIGEKMMQDHQIDAIDDATAIHAKTGRCFRRCRDDNIKLVNTNYTHQTTLNRLNCENLKARLEQRKIRESRKLSK